MSYQAKQIWSNYTTGTISREFGFPLVGNDFMVRLNKEYDCRVSDAPMAPGTLIIDLHCDGGLYYILGNGIPIFSIGPQGLTRNNAYKINRKEVNYIVSALDN